jgi:predicted MFS family arabinose efflux permease
VRGERLGASVRAARGVLAQPQLRRAELAFACALTGEWALTVGLAVVAFDDGGAAGVGLVALLRMAPAAIGTPFLAAVADRARRERALAAVSAVRAVTIGGAAALLAVDAHHAYVYALVVVATAVFTVFRPAHSSLLPLLCTTTTELTSANVVRGLLEALATLVGPVVAGALLAWSSPSAVFAAAALLSLAAMGLLLRIRYDAPELPIVEQPHLLQEAIEGVRSVARQRDLRLIFALGSTQAYVRGALTVFTVVLALDLLDLGESGVAALSAFIGVGGLVGSLGVSLLVGSRHLGGWLVVALVLWGTPITVIGLSPGAALAYAMVAVVGLANALIDVPLYTLPVRLVRDEVLTRAFGVFESTITIAVALGSVLTPPLIALLDLEGAMIATGLLLPLIGLLAWRRLATLDEQLSVRDVEIGVIRSAPMLQLLPVPSIEYLATEALTRTAPAGTELCRQGEPGDSFFVIADGHADVIGDGTPVRTMGPGECFGEIALLHGVARTATVRAREDLTVLEIDGDVFVDVVAHHSTTNAAALAVVDTHLADFRPARAGV